MTPHFPAPSAAHFRHRMARVAGLLHRAREYVTDSLEAHEHSDGRNLLNEIDAALRQEGIIP